MKQCSLGTIVDAPPGAMDAHLKRLPFRFTPELISPMLLRLLSEVRVNKVKDAVDTEVH